MSKPIVIDNLTVAYPSKRTSFTALEEVSLSIPAGQFVSVIGASGCGKSTLLSVLAGLRAPTSGAVLVGDEPVRGPGPERSVVFQQYALFPWMTAEANVAFAVAQARADVPRARRREVAASYLEQVGLSGFGRRYPKELSGGQQQRVAIARALAEDGDVLLMDEPFGAIDARNRAILQDLLVELWEGEQADPAGRKTVVFVTHDLDEAILLSDRIVMMGADAAAGVPGHVVLDVEVPLPRPRHRLEMIRTADYQAFRAQISEVFFADALDGSAAAHPAAVDAAADVRAGSAESGKELA